METETSEGQTGRRRPLEGPAVWRGADLPNISGWRRPLAASEIEALDAALRCSQTHCADWRDITVDTFPLGDFAASLARVRDNLENGLGLVKFSGLPVDRYDEDERRRIFFGIGAHLGNHVSQSAQGEMMGDIRDEGAEALRRGLITGDDDTKAFLSSRARVQTPALLRFHTDRTDVVGLLCVRPAAEGGISKVVSTQAIYNEILERRPDLLEVLCQDFNRSLFGQETGGREMIHALPVFCFRDGAFTSYYSRTYLEAAEKIPGVEPMTDIQVEALDMLGEVAEELCYDMHFAAGDMQFLNNHIMYHARSSFTDEAGEGRLLHRIWLSMSNGRALPESYRILWGNIESGALRGGIAQDTAA
ncbi:MAG: TauD/TfdA family dioxygenase [Alphaproteobacteria bacterium]|nr:TauD/TfdA family dioxygenase [Alphaproteobacteria bacterium]